MQRRPYKCRQNRGGRKGKRGKKTISLIPCEREKKKKKKILSTPNTQERRGGRIKINHDGSYCRKKGKEEEEDDTEISD